METVERGSVFVRHVVTLTARRSGSSFLTRFGVSALVDCRKGNLEKCVGTDAEHLLSERFALILRGALSAVYVMVLILGDPAKGAPTTRWAMATEYPESTVSGEGLSAFARLVKEKSHGEIEVIPSFGSDISSAQLIASIKRNETTGGDALTSALDGSSSIFELPALPFITQSTEDAVHLNERARPLYEAELRKRGITLLYLSIWPATGLWSKRPIRAPEGLSTLSIRTYDQTSESVMRQAGALAKQMPLKKVFPLLEDGEFNAVMSSGDGGAGQKLAGYLSTFTAIRYACPVSIAMIRTSSLTALPARLRHAVLDAAAETERLQRASAVSRTEANYAMMRAHDVTVVDPPDSDLSELLRFAAKDAIEEWQAKASKDAWAIFQAFSNRQSTKDERQR
ncbi:Solute-binding protein [Pandoraea iniqua]|uniref:TRAP transporter substrate-binding protein DctP n=1 Tax=Pandoraea TaxID=93217 RepID=UPI001257B977|nr:MULTISPECIES: TRAP transporter substrate-binding protein DctP [Pandoraea]VVE59295.1 Solute-binding protein [Pandoraea iniqua]